MQRQDTQDEVEEAALGLRCWLGVGGSNDAGSVFREKRQRRRHGSQVERRVSDEARRGSRP